jgi:hypothetical protein
MKKFILLLAIALLIVQGAEAKKRKKKPTPPPIVTPAPNGSFTAFLTAYASGDNDPKGTTTTYISGIEGNAGGTGTYQNPITMAVGYVGEKPDYPAGTKFYIPNLRRYFVVQDTCASCHKGKGGLPWLDVYVGDYSGPGSIQCEESITGNFKVIQNPISTYPVVPGSIYNGSKCSAQYGN